MAKKTLDKFISTRGTNVKEAKRNKAQLEKRRDEIDK
jgi:hypothetical protein